MSNKSFAQKYNDSIDTASYVLEAYHKADKIIKEADSLIEELKKRVEELEAGLREIRFEHDGLVAENRALIKSPWTPASSPPSRGGYYLVALDSVNSDNIVYRGAWGGFDSAGWAWSMHDTNGRGDVIAWMPIPEYTAPAENEKEDR